jgi:hypothetical protein
VHEVCHCATLETPNVLHTSHHDFWLIMSQREVSVHNLNVSVHVTSEEANCL